MTRPAPSVPSAAPTPAPDPAQLMDRLAQAAAAYYRNFAAVAAGRGLTLMQGKMLSLLRRPMPMRTLADLLACDASNVTGIVDRLEARDLVRREADPTDRRVKLVLLTDAGRRTVEEIRAELLADLSGLESLDEPDRHALLRLLGRVFPADGTRPPR
ncbi:MarR family winged helix-turn-helix transcriptional regulator [Kitasatospora sp. NPDC088346]|uniref:MarR family winged helix-turn-helix transcriptional regulator n=1 Tax=Kitasatospora sp. NPDC088346 TaxID=3364073 RepID=UPI00382DAA4B